MGENQKEESHIPARLNILFLIVFIFFAAIILRLAYVQLVEGEKYTHELLKYSTKKLQIPAPRGRILDRNGVELVSNKAVYTVTFLEQQGEQIKEEEVADKLANILVMNDEEKPRTDKELLEQIVQYNASLPISFKKEQTDKLISQIGPKIKGLPSVEVLKDFSDLELAKVAVSLNLRVKAPFDDKERETVKGKLKPYLASKKMNVDLNDAKDMDLLKYLISSNLTFPLKLGDKNRDDLIKDLKSIISPLKKADLKTESDMDLMRYANLFQIDVPLPLTDEQRRFQWRKIAILKNMLRNNLPGFMPRRIKENVSFAEIAKIEERLSELPGIKVDVEPIRRIRKDADHTPFGTHFLGYINTINESQLPEYLAQGYTERDKIGVSGLEKYYERELRGKDGITEVHVNKNSQTVEKSELRGAEPGNDLVLSIDYQFQSKVEEILKTQLETMRKDPKKPKNLNVAHALVMNPKTGEVLAMASTPDYDLNLHYDREKFNKVYKTEIAPNEENKIIRGGYPPGSTVKPISVMLALQENLTTERETIFDRGSWKVGNIYKKNWKPGGHGSVDARRALAVSNNTYMYAMSMRLRDRMNALGKSYKDGFSVVEYYNTQFGLGIKTGVDLPNELTGWKATSTELGNLADAFIGQYNNFTPMQLGQYVSAIANGGYRLRPHLVKEIRKGTTDSKLLGPLLTSMEPKVLNKVTINPQWLKVAQEGMLRVTQPGGTAYGTFASLPFHIAAKTGTAQVYGKEDNSLIVGYAPYENPQVAFVVIVPQGGHGSDSSGPIARDILKAYDQLYSGALSAAGATKK